MHFIKINRLLSFSIFNMKKILFLLLLFPSLTSIGQYLVQHSYALEEKFPGIRTLTVKEERYGYYKNWIHRSVYCFDERGNTIKVSYFAGVKRLASYEFIYNDKGLLTEETQTFHLQNKRKRNRQKETTRFFYEFDTQNRIIRKTTDSSNRDLFSLFYQDFDSNNNPQTIISRFRNSEGKRTIEYNSLNKPVLIQRFKNDSIIGIEEIRYNKYGDIIYSNVPTLLDKKTGKMQILIGGDRHAIVEEYEYVYDQANRWIEKYIVYDGKKELLQKRIFKDEKVKGKT